MSETSRRFFISLAVGLAALGLAACGGAQDDPAVRVGTSTITKAAVSHWMSEVAAGGSTAPGVPKFDTPQPPSYSACIAYFARYLPTSPGQAKPSHAALKAKCEFEYSKEKLKALYTLIAYYWVTGEAKELGVTLPPQEFTKMMTTVEHYPFPNGEGFRGYLASYRLTLADERRQLTVELLARLVERKLNHELRMRGVSEPQRQPALNRFAEEYERKWKRRTNCAAGYVVPICRQYKPPATPSTLVPNSIPLTNPAAEYQK